MHINVADHYEPRMRWELLQNIRKFIKEFIRECRRGRAMYND